MHVQTRPGKIVFQRLLRRVSRCGQTWTPGCIGMTEIRRSVARAVAAETKSERSLTMLPISSMELAVNRVINFLVAPLRLISRSVALLAVALLLIGAWGLTASLQTAQVARDALNGLTVSASTVAASIAVPLEHFADMTDGF